MKIPRWRPAATVTTAAVLMTLASIADASDLLPKGWIGGNIADYDIGVDRNIAKEGKASAYIKSNSCLTGGYSWKAPAYFCRGTPRGRS
ncbi:MAG: hypothetical protein AAB393_15680 [Bacteroidota bacterium]